MRVLLPALFMLIPVLAFAQVKRSNPPTLSAPTGYTHIVEVTGPNRTIYISGQIAFDKDGKIVGAGDMKAQAEQVFKNHELALTAAGAKFSDVVKMNSYITDMSKIQAVRDIRCALFQDNTPASTFVQVASIRPELLWRSKWSRSSLPVDHETARRIAGFAGCLGVLGGATPAISQANRSPSSMPRRQCATAG
jgi:enamine deaminase RidA (YjgF/YER057c/UK114 family)